MTLTSSGAKCRQDGSIDKACKSATLFSEVNANNRATLKVRNFSDAESRGSNGASDNPSRTIERSHEGTNGLQVGFSCLHHEESEISGDASPQ